MGAGCYYCNTLTGEKAAWIDFDRADDEDDKESEDNSLYIYESTIEDLTNILTNQCGYSKDYNHKNIFRNGLFKLTLESKYYGDGLIFMFDSAHSEFGYYDGKIDPRYILAKANLQRTENKVLREVMKAGYKVYMATGSYSCRELSKDEI